MASPSGPPPPPPPGAPKPKPDLNAVYRPFEDAALNAQIQEECQDPELPQQQAVNEVLELLAQSPATTNAPEASTGVAQAAAPIDLLDMTPAHAAVAEPVDLLGEEAPADLLGGVAPPAQEDLLGASPLVAPQSCATDLLGDNRASPSQAADISSAAPTTDLLGDISHSAQEADPFDVLLQAPLAAAPPKAPEEVPPGSVAENDDFNRLLAQQPLLTSSSAPSAHQSDAACRVRRTTTEDMEKVADMSTLPGVDRVGVPATINLSVPAPGEDLRDEEVQADDDASGAQRLVARVSDAVGAVIPSARCGAIFEGNRPDPKTKSQGFGSEDLFGPEKKTRSLTEGAAEAWSKFVSVLPDQVRQHIEAEELSTSRQNEAQPLVGAAAPCPEGVAGQMQSRSTGPISLAPPSNATTPEGGGWDVMDQETPLELAHKTAAINRACEGKWVPTYMRHQLAQGGHTAMPQGVNAHEYPADRPPPTVTSTFREMGQEVHENAQAMLTYMIAIISSLALQCQMCGQNTATTIHENAVDFQEHGFGFCNQARRTESGDEERLFGPWVDEAELGMGPVRSKVQRIIQGVNVDKIVDVAKCKLVLPRVPPGSQPIVSTVPASFQKWIKARVIARQSVDPLGNCESWAVSSEAECEALPQEAIPWLSCEGTFGVGLYFQEKWRVDHKEGKISVEFSNEHLSGTNAQVVVVIRMDIIERPDAADGCCEVESRLYAKPRDNGSVMPLGLVEQLTQLHNTCAYVLHDIVLRAAEDVESSTGRGTYDTGMPPSLQAPNVEASAAPLPVVNISMKWPAPENRPWASEQKSKLEQKLQAQPVGTDINLDKNLLLQVADGI